jgi:cobalamin biosynthesis protein CobT
MVRMYKQVKPMPVRNLEKGSLVGGDAYRAVVFGDTDIFERKINVESYDIAYSLLIDLSGSMSGTNLYTAIQTACLMGQVLAALNIPFEVVGFTSDGSGGGHAGFLRTTPLRHFVFKPFEERLSWKLFGRLENVLIGHISCSQNVDGEAVEWACKRLLPRKEKKRVLIVLSDGQPADGITPYDALHRHLKDMVEQYTKMGVVLIGIGMHTDAPANFYKNYVLLSDLNELPKTVIDQVERFIEKGR